MRRNLLVLTFALCAGCTNSRQAKDLRARGAGLTQEDTAQDTAQGKLREALRAIRAESQHYFSLAALPSRKQLQQAAEACNGDVWRQMTPLERFFVFGISSKIRAAAGPATVAEAYCAALRVMPADYWGMPGSLDTPQAHELLDLGRAAQPCLRAQLADSTPLVFKEGEANVLTEEFSWTISDLAASFLAAVSSVHFDARRTPAERQAMRQQLAHGTK